MSGPSNGYQLHLHTRATPGREEEYHRWYDEIHVAEVLGIEGFLTGARFAPVPLAPDAVPSGEYLAVYEIETDDPAATLQRLNGTAMDISPALDTSSVRVELYRSIGPRVVAA